MSLRINKPRLRAPEGGLETPGGGLPQLEPGDDWSSRVAKLIPAEALGLYGTAVGMMATWQAGSYNAGATLVAITLACCVLIILIRFKATEDKSESRGPQIVAIGIAIVSFLLWLAALAATGTGVSPFPEAWVVPYAPLAALLWGTFVPYFYKGD